MMIKEGSTKIVNFMTPWTGNLVIGHDNIGHFIKLMHYFI